ncbi:MAG: hypothetical protein WC430_03895 [Patescibacteria group bacterium]
MIFKIKNSKSVEGEYVDLRKEKLTAIDGFDVKKIEKFAKILRGLIFATVEASQSGHPGGSSSKVEQFLSLIFSGVLAFNPLDPKDPGRDRVVWSAGHCAPLLYSGLSLIYETMRREGRQFSPAVIKSVFPEDLIRFRHPDGPQGHAESCYPLSDYSTGPSGHGFSAAGGIALAHSSCGLDTKIWVFMGDAESEEGISYEARNVLTATGMKNLIVSLDYNHFGVDGPIEEVIASRYLNHWLGFGWNVIEVDGQNLSQLARAYQMAKKGFKNNSPTVVLSHTVKGKCYGAKENTAGSHGSMLNHSDYVKAVKKLGFNIPGEEGKTILDIEYIFGKLNEEDARYIARRMEIAAENIKPEGVLVKKMEKKLSGRPLVNPASIARPDVLPEELIFKFGEEISIRKSSSAFFKWLMKKTAFFYAGAGDLSKSVLTNEAEEIYGIINRKNILGRGIRFGIAEQNMAMMSSAMTQDILPGEFHPVSVFGTYAVFTLLSSHCIRLALVNNHLNPENKGFFIALASHDGPETGEDGPTHQGTFWMSLFGSLPGIKVYKPLDANECVEMLFYALKKAEPIILALPRTNTFVFERGNGTPPAREAINGAYVFRDFQNNGKRKIVLAISGAQIMMNVLKILPELAQDGLDVKIVAVTSPQLFEELQKNNPRKALEILPDEERKKTIILHNGWKGFLYPFILPSDCSERTIGVDSYFKSGSAEEIYKLAELDKNSLKNKIANAVNAFD